MKEFSQRNRRWADLEIGKSGLLMKDFGCYITALASLEEKPPNEILDLFNRNNCFNKEGLLDNEQAAKVLGCKYEKIIKNPYKPCVARVDYSPAPGMQTHFVVWIGNGEIMDPWTGTIKPNYWKVESYRVFLKKKDENAMASLPAPNKAIIKPVIEQNAGVWDRLLRWFSDVFCQLFRKSIK